MKKITITFILVFLGIIGRPCDCGYAGNFLKISKKVDLIAIVKLTQYNNYFLLTGASPNDINQPQSASFEIIKVLKGQENRKEIKVFGDNGFLCRPYIDQFQIEKYYIVGLFKCKDIEWDNGIKETTEDYQISACGDYWLEYFPNDETIKGVIDKKEGHRSVMALNKFEGILKEY